MPAYQNPRSARAATPFNGPTHKMDEPPKRRLTVPRRIHGLIALTFASALAASAQSVSVSQTGVPHPLAIERAARVTALRYDLTFTLRPHAASMPGHERIHFNLADSGRPLLLDFRNGTLSGAAVNGQPIAPTLENGHILLPGTSLKTGENLVDLAFTAPIATSGAAITRYEDKDDNSEYLYSLFVPMDASMAFPCFDQPDLKARFTLALDAPEQWTVIANTAPGPVEHDGAFATTHFPETRPISTYLFAFAAGPWVKVHPTQAQPDVYVRKSQVKRAEPEIPQLQEITARGMAFLSDYFQQPFPFPKYDIVLIPGFPFGGMEHAGETFLNESSVLYRSAPTAADRFSRNILTLHELSHQWFGDLVTMRWFDDLWLKEGFAQFMAYRALDSLDPASKPWKYFYETIKPPAYRIDETEGTTPIFQQIPNLKDAKSAYGAIVYQKAPSILKQLSFRLGDEAFRDGLRLYLKQHAYRNAQWSDLIDAFHTASGQDVRAWADAWVVRRGMPEITADWSCTAGRLTRLMLSQKDVLPDHSVWPISNQLLLSTPGHPDERLRLDWNTEHLEVKQAIGRPCPAYVFANANDQAYGRFLLDPRSERAITQALQPTAPDPFLRSMLWGALWDNVHTAATPPSAYVERVLANLPQETDETLARIQGGHATTALHTYMGEHTRLRYVSQLEAIAATRMAQAPTDGLRIVSFRTFTGVAETPSAREQIKHLLDGTLALPGVDLRPLDRWSLVGKLIAQGDPEAQLFYAREQKRDPNGDGPKYAWSVLAGTPDAATKKLYFAAYLEPPASPDARPEDWLTQSLGSFNAWNQQPLTAPYLTTALNQLPQIKRDRKIFFLGAWLGAFLGGQSSPEAEAAVHRWLTQPDIDRDLRLKVLENADELTRTVRIRAKFPTD